MTQKLIEKYWFPNCRKPVYLWDSNKYHNFYTLFNCYINIPINCGFNNFRINFDGSILIAQTHVYINLQIFKKPLRATERLVNLFQLICGFLIWLKLHGNILGKMYQFIFHQFHFIYSFVEIIFLLWLQSYKMKVTRSSRTKISFLRN